MSLWLILFSCASVDKSTDLADDAVVQNTVSQPARALRRLSLDIRGVLPSLSDYRAVMNDPDLLGEFAVDYLQDPLFETRVMHWQHHIFQTRVDFFDIYPEDYDLDPIQWTVPFVRSIGEEPLRLMAHIATNDLPWSEVVLADYTMSNPLLASLFPLAYPADHTGWEPSSYVDGRPAAGILAANGLWWRYPTDNFNQNRQRAAAISALLVCEDILLRPVVFEASDSVLNDTENALRTDPACLSCHSVIDPLASALFGFWWIEQFNPLEASRYHPERERMGVEILGVEPAFFGEPISNLTALGGAISQDPRFVDCAARQLMELLLRRKMTSLDFNRRIAHRQHFEESGLLYRELVLSVVSDSEYLKFQADDIDPRAAGAHLMMPEQMESAVFALTGFEWTDQGKPLLDYQYRALAGGVDGRQTFLAQRQPSLTTALTLKRLAQSAATWVAQRDLDGIGEGLLSWVDENSLPDSDAFQAQLHDLRLQMHGKSADSAWLEATAELWNQAYQRADATLAWTAVLSAMFQDTDFASL